MNDTLWLLVMAVLLCTILMEFLKTVVNQTNATNLFIKLRQTQRMTLFVLTVADYTFVVNKNTTKCNGYYMFQFKLK